MSSNGPSGGMGLCGVLTVVFVVLKLVGVVTWPWLWVLSPLWIPFAIVLSILMIVMISGGIYYSIVGWPKE